MDVKGSGTDVVERSKPTLIMLGKRKVISTGRWNDSVMADYVTEEGEHRWIKIGELAAVGCSRNTIDTKKLVRGRLSALFRELRDRNLFLAIRYDDEYHAASEVKIANLRDVDELQNVKDKLNSMKKRKEMSQDQYDKAIELLHKKVC
jgi:hypothetical protein